MTLKQLREQKFARQIDFAVAMHTSKATVCGWETGKRPPSVAQIVAMAQVLGVSRYEVFDIFANKNDSKKKSCCR